MSRFAVTLLALALAPTAALASTQGLVVMKKWKAMDKCAQQAQTAFPDFTPEAKAKRDAKLEECLEQQNLPARELPAPSR